MLLDSTISWKNTKAFWVILEVVVVGHICSRKNEIPIGQRQVTQADIFKAPLDDDDKLVQEMSP